MNNGERATEYLKYLESIGFDHLNPNNYIQDFISQITPDKAEDLLHESVKFLKEINGIPYSHCIALHPGDKERQYYKIRDYAIHVVNYFMLMKDYMIREKPVYDGERYEIEDKEQVIIPAAISISRSGIGLKTKMLISIYPEDDILDQEFNNIHDAFNKHEASYRIIFLLREFLKRLKFIYETKDFITDINLQDYHIILIMGLCCGIQFIKDDFSVIIYTNEKR